jgi:glycosyltransferase involved in cell wall biosynthesis
VLIIEHTDPESLVPSGIDTIIAGMVQHAPPLSVGIVGVTGSHARTLGEWHQIDTGDVTVLFYPVARIDRGVDASSIVRIPHSLRFIGGLIRHRRALKTGRSLQAHRAETGAALSVLSRKPLVQFLHNDSAGLLGAHSDSLWRKLPRIYRVLERRALRKSRATVLFNRADFPRVSGLATNAVRSLTWFDPEHFFPESSRLAPGEFRIVWAGRLESQKDPLLAVRVSHELSLRGFEHRLIIAGDGSMRGELLDYVRRHGMEASVSVVGALARPALAETMRMSDVFLMTSRYEGSPTVLAEAAASGLPTVATEEADPDLVLDDPRAGVRVSGRDPSRLADAVMSLSGGIDRHACAQVVADRTIARIAPRLLRLGL